MAILLVRVALTTSNGVSETRGIHSRRKILTIKLSSVAELLLQKLHMLHCWHVSLLHCSEDVAQLPCQVTHENKEQQNHMTTVRFELTPLRTGA